MHTTQTHALLSLYHFRLEETKLGSLSLSFLLTSYLASAVASLLLQSATHAHPHRTHVREREREKRLQTGGGRVKRTDCVCTFPPGTCALSPFRCWLPLSPYLHECVWCICVCLSVCLCVCLRLRTMIEFSSLVISLLLAQKKR